MSLAEAAAAGPPEDKRRPSKIDLWLESLPKDEREGAEAILAVGEQVIFAEAERGHQVG
mgnify:CR=1 FL=1